MLWCEHVVDETTQLVHCSPSATRDFLCCKQSCLLYNLLLLVCYAAVLIGLVGEWTTGLGLMEQTKDHPITVFAVFIILAFASYVPIVR